MCNPLLVAGKQVEAHVIHGTTYVRARDLVTGYGGLIMWDNEAQQAVVVPALAPAWASLEPLVAASAPWAAEYQMFQGRFDHIWAHALRKGVDPLLMVAILLHENTGSFDTNPANAAEYNGNGPDADWIADTARATSHVRGKLAYYYQVLAAGFETEAATLGLDGTAVQFVGWPGPIADHAPDWGCYAQHADWWQGVSQFYEELGGSVRLLSEYWRGGPVPMPQITLQCTAVTDQPALCSDELGETARPGVVTRVRA